MVDLSKIKAGDTVTVRMKVTGRRTDESLPVEAMFLTWSGDRSENIFVLGGDDIVAHTPQPLVAGDPVVHIGRHDRRGTIVATHESGRTWVDWGPSYVGPVTELLCYLERAP